MSRLRLRLRVGDILVVLLLILAVAAIGLYVAPTAGVMQQQGHNSTVWSKPGASNGSLQDRINPLTAPIFGPNVRANQDATTYGQHEPSLAVSRVHTNTIVVAQKDYRDANVKHVWIESSTDGGATWPTNRQLQMPGLNATLYPLQSDPVVMARDDGRIYVACLGYNNSNAVFITWTDDDGATWQNPSIRISPQDASLDDKDWFAIDNNPASPYYHRMYMMYAPAGAAYVAEQHSADGGLTWTARQQIGASNTEYTYPVVGSDGTVYNFMMLNWGFGQQGTIQLTKSTNGGVTWSAATTVASADQPNSPIRAGDQYRFYAILSAAVDPNNGSLYVAWTDKRNIATNGVDVLYVKSTNAGATWTSPTRLSHDPAGVVRDHITPMIVMGSDSRLHAFWLDRRLDPNNHLYDSWYSSSTDGGTTWDADTRVSTVSQDLNVGFPPGSNNAAGDYWGLDTTQDVVYVAWNDTRGGDQDILVSKGLLSSAGGGTPTSTPAVTNTPTATATTPPATTTVTATRTPTRTNTPSTPSPVPTNSSTSTATPSPSITNTRTNTPTLAPTITPGGPTLTATPTAPPTNTIPPSPTTNPSATATVIATSTATSATATATITPGCQLAQRFTDVEPGSTFYPYVQELACRSLISGYPCGGPGEPCDPQNRPYFRTNNNVSRGQLSKIVSGAAGFNEPVTGQTFEDIPVGSTFYEYIERLASRGIIGGYPCGGPGEPCGAGNLPYFRPNSNATRGQISKIVSEAAGFTDPPGSQMFEDVAPGSTYYYFIQRLAMRGVINGYPCGGPGEPCGTGNLPYFRPGSNATRGQTSKIVSNTFFP